MEAIKKVKLWNSILGACDGVTVTMQLGAKCTLHVEGNFLDLAQIFGEIMAFQETESDLDIYLSNKKSTND